MDEMDICIVTYRLLVSSIWERMKRNHLVGCILGHFPSRGDPLSVYNTPQMRGGSKNLWTKAAIARRPFTPALSSAGCSSYLKRQQYIVRNRTHTQNTETHIIAFLVISSNKQMVIRLPSDLQPNASGAALSNSSTVVSATNRFVCAGTICVFSYSQQTKLYVNSPGPIQKHDGNTQVPQTMPSSFRGCLGCLVCSFVYLCPPRIYSKRVVREETACASHIYLSSTNYANQSHSEMKTKSKQKDLRQALTQRDTEYKGGRCLTDSIGQLMMNVTVNIEKPQTYNFVLGMQPIRSGERDVPPGVISRFCIWTFVDRCKFVVGET